MVHNLQFELITGTWNEFNRSRISFGFSHLCIFSWCTHFVLFYWSGWYCEWPAGLEKIKCESRWTSIINNWYLRRITRPLPTKPCNTQIQQHNIYTPSIPSLMWWLLHSFDTTKNGILVSLYRQNGVLFVKVPRLLSWQKLHIVSRRQTQSYTYVI